MYCYCLWTRLWRHKFSSSSFFSNQAVFSIWPKSQDKNLNILRVKRAYKIKKKAFFIIFKGPPLKHIKQFFLECKSSTLTSVTFLSLYSACQKTVTFGAKAATHRGPQIWNLIPDEIKNVSSLENFMREIKKWKDEKCLCRICKTSALSKHKRCSTS